jgi:hypothetical protein
MSVQLNSSKASNSHKPLEIRNLQFVLVFISCAVADCSGTNTQEVPQVFIVDFNLQRNKMIKLI